MSRHNFFLNLGGGPYLQQYKCKVKKKVENIFGFGLQTCVSHGAFSTQ